MESCTATSLKRAKLKLPSYANTTDSDEELQSVSKKDILDA